MVRKLSGLILTIALSALPSFAHAGLFGEGAKPFIAPDRMFAVNLPTNWRVKQGENRNEILFQPAGRGDPLMFVRRIDVPEGADPMQLALRAIDERLGKMPSFRLQSKRRVTVGGHRAASVTGSYAHQGNIQYPRAVEEVFVVVGSEAFMLHFECFEKSAARYGAALNRFYSTFVPRPADAKDVKKEQKPFPEVEKMPF